TTCTDTDSNACTTAGCEAGVCVQTHVTKTCDPSTNECKNNPVCDPADGQCKSTNKADSTKCTDTDEQSCTTAGCEAGVCVQTHITSCEVLCRTPGFWGTHGCGTAGGVTGCEKSDAKNLTQIAITLAGGSLSICGETITNDKVPDNNSALEAICTTGGGKIH